MTNEPTDGNAFKLFMSELYNNLSELEKKNNVFFLDNLSSHSTPELFELYNNNNMKIIFNAPYKSSFYMVKLVFRLIKRETYTYLFNNMDLLKNAIAHILKGEHIKVKLKIFLSIYS